MVRTTRAQRVALKRVFDRGPIYSDFDTLRYRREFRDRFCKRLTYRQFRKSVHVGSGCIMIHWCGMWLGIEPDGYTHS